MYLKATDLDRCYDSTESRVKVVSEVFDVLINPDRLSDLNDIEVTDFSHFLNIGHRGFLDLIDPVHRDEDGDRRNTYWEDIYSYDSSSAQLVLEWIANEEKIARSILSKDEDLDIIRHLFCIAGRSVSEEEQKQYICDLWGLEGANCDTPFAINGDDINITNWTGTGNWLDDPENTSCHDTPASVYIGLTQGEYDDVGFSTYAEAQDNDNAVEMATDLIGYICSSANAEDLAVCLQFYICPVLVEYEGYELDSCVLYKEKLGL